MEAAQATCGPARPAKPKPDAIRVTAVDANLALPWDKMFDGSPFTGWPRWLLAALEAGDVAPHTTGGTDYAQWHVRTPGELKNARPGDWIVRRPNGELDVCRDEIAEAVRAGHDGRESAESKMARNDRVAARYDELMRDGQHGHYENLFCVVREEVERAVRTAAASTREATP